MKKLFIMLLSFAFIIGCQSIKTPLKAKIISVKGIVEIEGSKRTNYFAKVGDFVCQNEYIVTSDNSKVQLILPERGVIQIGSRSTVHFKDMFKQETNVSYGLNLMSGKITLALKN